MLKIPQYEQSVRATGYSTSVPQAIDVNKGLVRGLAVTANNFRDAEIKHAELEAEEALQSFVRAENGLLLTGDNPYYGTRGKDSVDQAEPTIKALETLKRDHLSRLKNPRAQQLLSQSLERRMTAAQGRIQARALDGQREWDVSQAEAGVEQAGEQIQLYANDPIQVRAGEAAIKAHLQVALAGMGADKINEKTETAVSKALAAGIATEIDRNPYGAQKLYKQYEDKLEPAERARVKKAIKAQTDLYAVTAAADKIRQGGASITDRQAAARKQFKDPKLRAELVRQVTNDYNMTVAAQQEENRLRTEEYLDDMNFRGVTLKDLMHMDPEGLEALDNAQFKALQAIEAANAKALSVSDPDVWIAAHAVTDDEFRDPNFDPRKYTQHLSPSNAATFLGWMRKARGDKKAKSTGLRTHLQMVRDAVSGIEDEAERLSVFNFIDEHVRKIEGETGADISTDDLNKIVSDVMLPRRFYDHGYFGGVEELALYETDIDNVGVAFRKAHKQAYLETFGREMSDSELLHEWRLDRMRKFRQQGMVIQAVDAVNQATGN